MDKFILCNQELDNRLNMIKEFLDFVNEQKENKIFRTPIIYNAVIISIYGCFENYIDDLFDEYLDEIYKLSEKYEELPQKIKDKHIVKTGEFITNPNRYQNYGLSVDEVIFNLCNSINNTENAELNKKLILTHSGNLKIGVIIKLMEELGIESAIDKIIFDNDFLDYYCNMHELGKNNAKKRINERKKDDKNELFGEWQRLVEQRNSVAHSWVVEERISYSSINSAIIPFVKLLGKVILNVILSEILFVYQDKNMLKKITSIYCIYDNKILCFNNNSARLQVGTFVYAKNEKGWIVLKILNIQVNKRSIQKIEDDNMDIGVLVDKHIKKNWEYYYCL